jgi:hypothetical protein
MIIHEGKLRRYYSNSEDYNDLPLVFHQGNWYIAEYRNSVILAHYPCKDLELIPWSFLNASADKCTYCMARVPDHVQFVAKMAK